ncbi:hypothetical protein ABOM_012223 [Aspergillus bombycis]|uniref:Uncharacterized protein n=1 Tax=Aspergillus bombycis TaxID=109264 RepID=A0A1F7ZIW5_9EURO|nr:hypothetical protein ABOM_012223 [Aspergillus bombycis]
MDRMLLQIQNLQDTYWKGLFF